jgi:hypothetical protein
LEHGISNLEFLFPPSRLHFSFLLSVFCFSPNVTDSVTGLSRVKRYDYPVSIGLSPRHRQNTDPDKPRFPALNLNPNLNLARA